MHRSGLEWLLTLIYRDCERLGTLRFTLDAQQQVTIHEETDSLDEEQDVVLVNVSPLVRCTSFS